MDTAFVALRVVLSLGAVLALLWYAQRRIMRGRAGTKTVDLVSVVGRQSIGLKASVVVIDVGGSRFLLGVTEHSVNVLHGGDAPRDLAAVEPDPAADFAATLADVTNIDSAGSEPQQLRPRRNSPQVQASGSILSAATWKQTAAAIRQIR